MRVPTRAIVAAAIVGAFATPVIAVAAATAAPAGTRIEVGAGATEVGAAEVGGTEAGAAEVGAGAGTSGAETAPGAERAVPTVPEVPLPLPGRLADPQGTGAVQRADPTAQPTDEPTDGPDGQGGQGGQGGDDDEYGYGGDIGGEEFPSTGPEGPGGPQGPGGPEIQGEETPEVQGEELPVTGSSASTVVAAGLGLLVAGIALVVVGRRRLTQVRSTTGR